MLKVLNCSRTFFTSSLFSAKEVKATKSGNKITVEGVPLNDEKKCLFQDLNDLLKTLSKTLEYTDVLILRQFLDSSGNVLPINITKLTKGNQLKVELLIDRSKRAGLLPEKITEDGKYIYYDGGVHKFHVYYNRNVIGYPMRKKMFPSLKLRNS